jgi:hypothetical protein
MRFLQKIDVLPDHLKGNDAVIIALQAAARLDYETLAKRPEDSGNRSQGEDQGVGVLLDRYLLHRQEQQGWVTGSNQLYVSVIPAIGFMCGLYGGYIALPFFNKAHSLVWDWAQVFQVDQ